uniref:Uncharacterized protein n=1 Tax=Amphora coffeiformis TaxID=265554 RepID=A0A7S3L658_9STRA|mmetsp:Transcript_25844/g.48939  ORF Transcript_25844/g.48939 Transcript_25844/m.48939 type:complete len:197 (-) Transcript_25844:114-704(-)|eukprot:scaffold4223_cov189-Amphora_coffeaeformis.AAC.11
MTSVDQSNTSLSFSQLAGLVEPDNLKVLRLTNVEITGDDDDVFDFSRAIRGHPSLEEVHLTNITFKEDGVNLDLIVEMMLVSCHELHLLKLDNVPVRAKSCSTLAYCETLTTLALTNNKFNDVDAKMIADSVESNKSVTSVDLSDNCISDVGCKSLRLCLEKNSVIQEISLSGNSISGTESNMLETKLLARVASAA